MRDPVLIQTFALPTGVNSAEERIGQERAALDRFLAGVERRAFRMARIAVRHHEDALDIVQDAMFRLARRYATASPDEWPLLFFRILRNRILDHQRRQGVRNRVLALFPGRPGEEDHERDAISDVPARDADGPESQVALDVAMGALESAVSRLPGRQQQVFLLRTLEGLDVASTAAVMGCSEGSVKTHYSRAVHSLRAVLGDHWS